MESEMDSVQAERQTVYGDPTSNHRGIGKHWAAVLRPWWRHLKRWGDLPEHVVCLMLSLLKDNRKRLGYKHDNYLDGVVYQRFAERMQESYDGPRPDGEMFDRYEGIERIYVAGPLTTGGGDRESNYRKAIEVAVSLMAKGHDVVCPHAATVPVEDAGAAYPHDRWMRLDLGLIYHWATAIYFIGPSVGANMELALAEELGLRVYRSLDEVRPAVV